MIVLKELLFKKRKSIVLEFGFLVSKFASHQIILKITQVSIWWGEDLIKCARAKRLRRISKMSFISNEG